MVLAVAGATAARRRGLRSGGRLAGVSVGTEAHAGGGAGHGGRQGFEEVGVGRRRSDGRLDVVLELDHVDPAGHGASWEFGGKGSGHGSLESR